MDEAMRLGVDQAIGLIEAWEKAGLVEFPGTGGSRHLRKLFSTERICVETTLQSDDVGASAFLGAYEETSATGEVLKVEGPPSIHVMPKYLPKRGEYFSYSQQVYLALMLMHEEFHHSDIKVGRLNRVEHEFAAYSWCLTTLTTGFLARQEVTGTIRTSICDYLVSCIEQLRTIGEPTIINVLLVARRVANRDFPDFTHGPYDPVRKVVSPEVFMDALIDELASICRVPFDDGNRKTVEAALNVQDGGGIQSLVGARWAEAITASDARTGDLIQYASDGKRCLGVIESLQGGQATVFSCHGALPENKRKGGLGVSEAMVTLSENVVIVRWSLKPVPVH